jgi:hypothetical protein
VRPDAEARRGAHALFLEVAGLEHGLRGHDAVGKDLLLVVDIVDKHVQGTAALLETAAHLGPLPRGDDPGNKIEGPGAVDIARLAVDGEGDAHLADRDLGRGAARLEVLVVQLLSSFTAGRATCRGVPLGVISSSK